MLTPTPTGIHKNLLNQIKQLLNNHNKLILWVPLTTFLLGSLAALAQYFFSRNPKYSVGQPCTICYSQNRSVLTEPCRHLVLCVKCAWMVEICPFCRVAIAQRTPIAKYINE